MFVSMSFILAREIVPSPIFLATISAVFGITCISPPAPTSERALMMKRDSWRNEAIRPFDVEPGGLRIALDNRAERRQVAQRKIMLGLRPVGGAHSPVIELDAACVLGDCEQLPVG